MTKKKTLTDSGVYDRLEKYLPTVLKDRIKKDEQIVSKSFT